MNKKSRRFRKFAIPSRKGGESFVKLNAAGEIVDDFTSEKSEIIGETEQGEKYYTEGGNTFIDYRDAKGKQTKIKINRSVLGPIVNDYINYLRDNKKIDIRKLDGSDVIIMEGELPGKEEKNQTEEYSGKSEEISINNKKKQFIIVDKRLSDEKKIAVIYHELVHARGEGDETKTQNETIYGLREMLKSYPDLMKNEASWEEYFGSGNDPDVLEAEGYKKGTLRGAVNYAISSRKSFDLSSRDIRKSLRKSERAGSKGKLERKVAAIIAICIGVIFLILKPNITGAVIGSAGTKIGVFLILGLLLFLIKSFVKNENS